MANERPIQSADGKTEAEKRKEFRARTARLVTRGHIVDRLNVQLPADVHGEWIRDDAVAIAEAQALGFEIDTKYAVQNKLHTDASGKAKVGDAVFMTIPKWMKEEIDSIKAEQTAVHHGTKKGTKPVEERDYENSAGSTIIPTTNASTTNNVPIKDVV